MSQMIPKKILHNTTFSVQLPYTAALKRCKFKQKNQPNIIYKEKWQLLDQWLTAEKGALCPNLMNLSRVSNPQKNRFQLSAGLDLKN